MSRHLETWRHHLFTWDFESSEGPYLNDVAILTRASITGISMRGPITVATAWLELVPNIAVHAASASSKLLLAAVNAKTT